MKNKKGSSKKKISLFKLNNKRLNRLSKQGKLKKAVGKNKLVSLLNERLSGKKFNKGTVPEEKQPPEEPDIPLQEADYEYFATSGRDYSFLTELSEEKKSKRKRKSRYEEEERNYEEEYQQTRGKPEADVRFLLPIKSKKQLIQRCVEVEKADKDSDDDQEENELKGDMAENEDDELVDEDGEVKDNDGETEVERVINEEQKKQEIKRFIKVSCMQVIQDIDENISKLHLVLHHMSARRPASITTYAMLSLLEVYKDIIPDYKIREVSSEEKEQRMKKETLRLLSSEESLLKSYKRYLDTLHDFIKGKNLTSKNRNNPSVKLMRKKRLLRKEAIRCLGELLSSKSHFNYRTQVVASLTGALFHHHSKTSEMACEMVKKVFSADKQGEVTLEIVRLIGRAIKEKKFDVKARVLDTFLSLRIRHAEKDGGGDDGEDGKRQASVERHKREAMSRKEKKRQKNLKHLEKELKEVALADDSKHKKKLQTETVSVVFLVYFRILKQAHSSTLLSSVLEGLTRFCHLINVSFFDDLFSILTKFVNSGDLTTSQNLRCIQTALSLLMGQGSAFNIDPHNFYVHLFNLLFSFDLYNYSKDLPSVLTCLKLMFIERRRQVSDQRCLPYIKKMCTLATRLPPSASLPLLCLVRSMLQLYPKCDMLLDTESIGSGVFQPESTQPDHSNAQSTSLFELHLLRSSYHPDVSHMSEHLLNHLPTSGRLSLPSSLARMPQNELHQDDFECVLRRLEKLQPKGDVGEKKKEKEEGCGEAAQRTSSKASMSNVKDSQLKAVVKGNKKKVSKKVKNGAVGSKVMNGSDVIRGSNDKKLVIIGSEKTSKDGGGKHKKKSNIKKPKGKESKGLSKTQF